MSASNSRRKCAARLREGLLVLQLAPRAFPAQGQIPILCRFLGASKTIFLGCFPPFLAVQIGRTIPAVKGFAPANPDFPAQTRIDFGHFRFLRLFEFFLGDRITPKWADQQSHYDIDLIYFLATPAERGEPKKFNSLPTKVPNSAVIRDQWLTRHGSNFFESLPAKKKVAGRVAALSDDKQKFNAIPDYQKPQNPASSGWEVQS